MFEFTFSKVKVDCLYLNKDALQPKKENCWKSIQSTCVLCFIHFDFKRWLKPHSGSFIHFSFFFLKFLSFTPTTFFGQFTHLWIVPLLQYHLHQNNKSVICYVVFLFWDHDGGTGPKMEPMLDFNESAKNNWK